MDSLNDMALAQLDPEIQATLDAELGRQRDTLETIASENSVPRVVLEAQSSVLTNRYAEGYPDRRYYDGCELVDVAKSLAIGCAKQISGDDYVSVQPHVDARASAVALMAMANVDDPTLGPSLARGGHLTHSMRLNFSGKNYKAVAYEVDRETIRIEPEEIREAALAGRPCTIIAGWPAYPCHLDFQAFRDIADEVGAVLWMDMVHFAGLAAMRLRLSPVSFADVVTTMIHRTLSGPRSGMVLPSRGEQWGKKLNSSVLPGQQGGPLMYAIAAKAIAMRVARTGEFKDRQCRIPEGTQIIARRLGADGAKTVGVKLVTGDTDVHLVLVDLIDSRLNGQQTEDLLHGVNVTVNRNAAPFDPRPPVVTLSLRIDTPALAMRGFDAEDFAEVAGIIGTTLSQGASGGNVRVDALRVRVKKLTDKHPLYAGLRSRGLPGGTPPGPWIARRSSPPLRWS